LRQMYQLTRNQLVVELRTIASDGKRSDSMPGPLTFTLYSPVPDISFTLLI
jgi:hypothetical protein